MSSVRAGGRPAKGRGGVMMRFVAKGLGLYMDLVQRTTRWTVVGEEHIPANPSTIVAFWHERVAVMPIFWRVAQRRGRMPGKAYVLASRHRDGQAIGVVARYFGMNVVYGSSAKVGADGVVRDKGGRAGLRQLLALLAQGHHVAVTPDGPRGPRRKAAAGIAQLAALSGVSVLPIAAQTAWKIELGSWDRMVVPFPFGRGVLVCGAPVVVDRAHRDKGLLAIEQAMTEAADRADALCRR